MLRVCALRRGVIASSLLVILLSLAPEALVAQRVHERETRSSRRARYYDIRTREGLEALIREAERIHNAPAEMRREVREAFAQAELSARRAFELATAERLQPALAETSDWPPYLTVPADQRLENHEYVSWLQATVGKKLGRPVRVDGIIGPETIRAVVDVAVHRDGLDSAPTDDAARFSRGEVILVGEALREWAGIETMRVEDAADLADRVARTNVALGRLPGAVREWQGSQVVQVDLDEPSRPGALFARGRSALVDDERFVTDAHVVRNLGSKSPVGQESAFEPAEVVVRSGGARRADLDDLFNTGASIGVLRSRGSRIRTAADVRSAVRLLNRPTRAENTLVLDALPTHRGLDPLRTQLASMGLDPREAEAWRGVLEEIDGITAASPVPHRVATRETVLKELREGTSNAVVLVGHFDGGRFEFPDGSHLSVSEIREIQRPDKPNRFVWLVSCKAGAVMGSEMTPAEAIIDSGAASIVLASRSYVSGADVPDLMRALLVDGVAVQRLLKSRTDFLPIVDQDS